ncbi:hypothetical protein [Streptomyces sp. NBC_01171]|uniref:hypothetical protein n=1 Tax=Streptomyces sp. NBC_01171 TaxID=2903757 RepID=UPI003868C670|nr:hypothetical protein OG448_17125 [Streptomyces sp. NBC_01171]
MTDTADQAVERLRTALRDAGIVLPSLRVDPVTEVYGGGNTLVDLGSCNLDVAARLAAVLTEREGE